MCGNHLQSFTIGCMVYIKKMTVKERFLSHIDKSSSCWRWKRQLDKDGYGRFWMERKGVPAHRASWMIFKKKEIPKGLFICHKCDNPSCVRPSHLFLGTNSDNIQDAIKKNRMKGPRGEKQHCAIFTTEEVLEIRRMSAEDKINGNRIANHYGVDRHRIYDILKRITWKHI
jgi:HNH endonuclease